jgi:hypothetical protein
MTPYTPAPPLAATLAAGATLIVLPVEPQPFLVLHEAEWHSRAMSGVDPYGFRPVGSHTPESLLKACPLQVGVTYRLPDDTTFTVAAVELRRVNTITEAEAVAAGFTESYWKSNGRDIYNSAGCNFRIDFIKHHGREAWDENRWCRFVSIDNRKGIER